MDKIMIETLEYKKIKEQLKEYATSSIGKNLVDKLEPYKDIVLINEKLKLVNEAVKIIESNGTVPIQSLSGMEEVIIKLEKGTILKAEELYTVAEFLRGCRRVKKFMENCEFIAPILSGYSASISEVKEIEDEIYSSIANGMVKSTASSKLLKIRKQIDILENRIEQKANSIINSSTYSKYLQEKFITKRNGRYTVPVKASFKSMIPGSVIAKSSTGSTLFVEPESIGKMSGELELLKIEEEQEIYQVLSGLTGYVTLAERQISINVELLAEYDFIFAKARFGLFMKGSVPKMTETDEILISKGRHPLLKEKPVPLNLNIGKNNRALIITGPNTGGKTVSLKTVGLLCLMAQSGMMVPCDKNSKFPVFERIFTDIGDRQSIENSLSTFSAHMKNIVNIVNKSRKSTLVLVDEIGTGTDPREGAAIAASVLEELYLKGAITIATTHYGEIKDFGEKREGFINGRMKFDKKTLKPLYVLEVGKSGESNAFWISKEMGLSDKVLNRARKYVSNTTSKNKEFEVDTAKPKTYKKKKSKYNSKKEGTYKEFEIGDSVIIKDTEEKGIIASKRDDFGNYEMTLKGKTIKINHKRLELFISKEELYPEGYDVEGMFVPWKQKKFEKDLKRGSIKRTKDLKKRFKEVYS